ncbi:flagellar hook-basal body complex protein FliE [Geomicrobium sediminis]|uniref:Flagellar hook-basal body complex protein FliE n=1 Tax=Geomicrobium sediminis TaxID=1347788 RepID=A0ABS2PB08_9BACL|nr:flagellar hook-basal body complex protein FliE [Geomicrobium sediminis]
MTIQHTSMFAPVQSIAKETIQPRVERTAADAHESFATTLQQAIQSVNNEQQHSQEMTTRLVNGDVESLHDVMIASEKSGIALQATVEVRNKVVEAYETMMRMQV